MYQKQEWTKGEAGGTPFSDTRMDHIEDGIAQSDITNPESDARKYLDGLGLGFGSGGSIDVATRGFKHDEDNTARFDALIAEVKVSKRRILLSDGIWPGQVTIRDQDALFDKNRTGFVGHMKGKHALLIDHTLGAEQAITDVRHVYLPLADTRNPNDSYAALTLSRASMAAVNPQRGDALWLYSDNYALDAAKNTTAPDGAVILGAADFNGEGKKTYTGDWASVLGVGIDVVDVAGSGGVRQGSQVVGATSKATAWVSSSVVSSQGQRVAILNDVRAGTGPGEGYFEVGEQLTVDGVVRGSISRGPYILTAQPIEQDISLNPTLRKGRTDLQVDLDGFASIAIDDDWKRADVDQFIGKENRLAAVRTNTVVGGTGTPWVPLSWKHGVEHAAAYKWKRSGVVIDGGPAHAEDYEGGWSYGLVMLGGCSWNEWVCYGTNVRHVTDTNTRPTDSPIRTYEYVITKGRAHDNNIHDSTAFACLDYGFDEHGGSFRNRYRGNIIDGGGAGGRSQGRAAGGFQLRGHGAIVEGNTISNVVDGIREISTFFPAPFDMDVIIKDNTMTGIIGTAYNLLSGSKGDETKGKTRVHIYDPIGFLAPNLTVNNAPANPNSATFLRMDVGWLELKVPNFYGLRSGSPGYFGVEGTDIRPDYVKIVGGEVDYTSVQAGSTVRGWQIQSVAPIPYFGIFGHQVSGNPTSIVRNGAVGQQIYTNDAEDIDSSSTLTFVQNYTPANQPGTTNWTDANGVAGTNPPKTGTAQIIATRETGAILATQWTPPAAPGAIQAGKFWSAVVPLDGAAQGDWARPVWVGNLPDGVVVENATVTRNAVTFYLRNMGDTEATVPAGAIRIRIER